ncbi:MAG: hypothetical protein H6742_10150 [Alphaproteobacteria bacterium]|nr:hypothetical protein [Alphaproteobacteria bacterium]
MHGLCPLLLLTLGCAGDGAADTASPGSGSISGSYDGRPFDTVGATWRIGEPDDPDQTMVVYVFDNPIPCADIAEPGWDTAITDQTQAVEIKLVGLEAGTYPLTAGRTPGPGEADVNYTLSSTTGTPAEISADSGAIVVDSTDGDGAVGSFELVFATGDTLTGTFDATPCPTGSEP